MTKQDEFIKRAGFNYGWGNLESWARRMADRAVEEIGKLEQQVADHIKREAMLRDALGVAHNNAVQCGLMVPKNSMTDLSIALCKMEEAIDAALSAQQEDLK